MKKHSLYLREDQIAFLRSLDNASSFVREALDVAIASERGSTEKTICLYEGTKELEAKIASQALILEGARKEAQKIEEEIKQPQFYLGIVQNVAHGKNIELRQVKGKWEALTPSKEGKYMRITSGHDTEEEAKTRAIERGKIGIKNMKRELKELEQKKQRHEQYVEAQKAKLKDMEKNLEALKASMK